MKNTSWWRTKWKWWPYPIRGAFAGFIIGLAVSVSKVGLLLGLVTGAILSFIGLLLGALYEPIADARRAKELKARIGRKGFTPLMCAAALGDLALVREMVTNNIEIDVRDELGATALLWAISEGQMDAVKFLLDSGARMDIRTKRGTDVFKLAEGNPDIEKLVNTIRLQPGHREP